jgi:hypothetical protein
MADAKESELVRGLGAVVAALKRVRRGEGDTLDLAVAARVRAVLSDDTNRPCRGGHLPRGYVP